LTPALLNMKQILVTLLIAVGLWARAAAAPTLIPFQGRLTDQSGNAYTNGQFTLIFTLYDQAVGGAVLWTETHQKVGVINGVVNVFLGAINPALVSVDFSPTRYLGITIDPDNNPSTPDPEMVPRQMIIPAFWAQQADNAKLLAGAGWSSILKEGNDPRTGFIDGARIATGSIPDSRLAPASFFSGPPVRFLQISKVRTSAIEHIPMQHNQWVAITNLDVSVVSTGRPMWIGLTGLSPETQGPDLDDAPFLQTSTTSPQGQFFPAFVLKITDRSSNDRVLASSYFSHVAETRIDYDRCQSIVVLPPGTHVLRLSVRIDRPQGQIASAGDELFLNRLRLLAVGL
jgi:hypothetical protein